MAKLLTATPSLIELSLAPGKPMSLRTKFLYLPHLKKLNLWNVRLSFTKLGLFLTTVLLLEELTAIYCEKLHKGSLLSVPEEACRHLTIVNFSRTLVCQETIDFFRERALALETVIFDTIMN